MTPDKQRKDEMIRTTLIAAAALTAMAAATPAMADEAMNDLEIAHTAYTAGNIDIRYAHLALAISDDPQVREFASTMIRDHSAVNDAAVALIQKLDVTPQDNALSQALVRGAQDKRDELRLLVGPAFDCAYAANELGYHQVVNKTVEETFIPNTTVPELKALLSDALDTFKAHEGHAGRMVSALDCGS